jgi:glutamate-ammonia-ligase adenylyltransferase
MTATENKAVQETIAAWPAELQELVSLWTDRLHEQDADLPGGGHELQVLLRLVASSDFAARVLLRDWEWFQAALTSGALSGPPQTTAIRKFVDEIDATAADTSVIKSRLRQFRNRTLLHILWRSIEGSADLQESLASLSNLADGLIEAAVAASDHLLSPRFGQARNKDGQEIPLVVLAMGKLGGRELNFSSDIDVIFLYREEGETDGPRSLSAHEYFTRRSRQIVALLDEVTADGFVYRVDTRLRPFGASGPPVTSFASLESYLLQHGRSWERYAYIKARVVSPCSDQATVRDLMDNIIEPFVYRRYLDYGVFESLRDMKALISVEVQKRELASNIKLGPGGIREIEFIAQSLQLVRGGGDRQLRTPELQTVLPVLASGKGLSSSTVSGLLNAYIVLRKLENAMQAVHDRQTHDLPQDALDQARLVLALNYETWQALVDDLDAQRQEVSKNFDDLLFRLDEEPSQPELVTALTTLWDTGASAEQWQELLHEHEYREADLLAATLAGFATASIQRHADATAQRRLGRFMPQLLLQLQDRQTPNLILERILRIISQILRRSAYVSLLIENPAVLGRLVGLCENSAYLAQEIARYPLLLDELLDPRLHSATITAADMREDLEQRVNSIDPTDSERQIEVLGQFQRANLFRIAVADHGGKLPIMKVSDRLTELAEIVLNRALEIAWADLVNKHGVPTFSRADGERKAGFGVIAYGKLGGMELSYGSDLDLVFLHDSSGSKQETDGEHPLDNSMFFGRLVRRLTHFLTAQTASGALYEVDTRLRPSGRSGLMVSTVEGFERYQEDNAWTWEHQALLRSRPVAGSAIIAREFERIRSETLRHRVRREQLLEDVLSMRARMRKQLDKSTEQQFDLKQGAGGIGDIEFLVQYLVLKNANEQPAVIHYPDNIRQLGTLAAASCLAESDVVRLQEIYKAYRLCLHRLALDEQPPLVASDAFPEEREFVAQIWERELIHEGGNL